MKPRTIAIILTIFLSSTISAIIAVDKPFNYPCKLQKPHGFNAAMTPSFSFMNSLKFKVSHRITHELETRVFAIYLREIFDFDKKIIIDTFDEDKWKKFVDAEDDNTAEYYYYQDLFESQIPTINMEVWRTADNREFYSNKAHESNSLSMNDVFRFGLYVPQNLLKDNQKLSYKHFISGTNYESVKQSFNLNNETFMKQNIEHFTENVTISFLNVTNGIYDPHRCHSAAEPCAIILTSHYVDTHSLIRVVDSFNMRAKIYFLGENFKRKIKDLTEVIKHNKSKKIFFVYHWTPSEVIDGKTNFSSVEMPACEEMKRLNYNINCKFDPNTVSIMYNQELKDRASDFADWLINVKFLSIMPLIEMYEERYLQFIDNAIVHKKYSSTLKEATNETEIKEDTRQGLENIYNSIACDFLRNNKKYYDDGDSAWFRGVSSTTTIYIGGLFSNEKNSVEYDGITTAIQMAKDYFDVSKNFGSQKYVPEHYNIAISNQSVECKPDLMLKEYIKFFTDRKLLLGIMGPPCSEAVEVVSIISKNYKMSTITYSAEGISFEKRENYPFFFRTIGENTQYHDVFKQLFTKMKWQRIAAITEDGQKYTEYISRMETANDFKTMMKRTISHETNVEKFLTALKEVDKARIIICDIHDHLLMKPILCMANKLQMTAENGYVWFLPVYVSLKLNETSVPYSNESCSASELSRALDKHFAMAHVNFGEDSDELLTGQKISEWKESYKSSRVPKIDFISPADYAPFVYDTIWVYVMALSALNKSDTNSYYLKNLNQVDTQIKLAEIIQNTNFKGVSGQIQFNKAGSRYTDINIFQWQSNNYTLVGTYHPHVINRESHNGTLHWNNKVKWINDKVPDDGRESCFLDFLGIECQLISSIIIAFFCVFTILACSCFSFLFWKHKYAKKLEESTQIMTNYGLVVNGIELSRWELARENVILNRRIGEGAFGTVYGGEALIKDTEGWIPVAIKTLKPHATPEARLDFLAESEVMKRFDHKNIVKLLAVCLQKEPLFMLSEFMLYGDLKTFLLARRHLVDDKIHDDTNDISPKRLTLMALDIARGLSYLGSLNFIHRDIACRNCLINAQRICKIGDFGMARSTSDNDYYRFTRKGMLPVRWMSPESVSGGMFSHASDVWAFGVFLFEVVTLGGFPFQGLNNEQVFSLVKSGGSVKIPSKCKPALRALMSSVFNLDPKKRPGASTIVEFISSHPRMLTPCMMDAPKPNLNEQVNLLDDNNEDLEFDQLAETRERSHTPATINIDFLRTSASASALQSQSRNQEFEYLDMKMPKRNGMYSRQTPDLTATLPNGNYNPIEPLLQQQRPEISKSTLSLLKMYVPMCGKNRNRSSHEECTTSI